MSDFSESESDLLDIDLSSLTSSDLDGLSDDDDDDESLIEFLASATDDSSFGTISDGLSQLDSEESNPEFRNSDIVHLMPDSHHEETESQEDSTAVFSNFLMRRPMDIISMKAPAPPGDLLWQVTLIPVSEVMYTRRIHWLRCAQIVFTRTINCYDVVYHDVSKIIYNTHEYVQNHPQRYNAPYDPQISVDMNAQTLFEINDSFSTSNHGVLSHVFQRSETECSWMSAPAPAGELVLEMALYPFSDVAGVRFEERYKQAILHLCHTIRTDGTTYKDLIPIIKAVYQGIHSHPRKQMTSSCRIDDALL